MSNFLTGSAQAPPLQVTSAIFMVLMTSAVAFASRRWPIVALGCLLLAIPFNFARSVGPTTIDLPKLFVIAIVLVAIINRRFEALFPTSRLTWSIASLGLVLAALDAFGATHAGDRGACFRESLKALQYIVTFVVATYLTRISNRRSSHLLVAISVVATVVSLAALSDEFVARRSVLSVGASLITRVAGPLEGPNQLAGYLQLFVPLIAAGLISVTAGKARVTAVAAFAVSSIALALTFSRSGLASAALAVAFAVGIEIRSRTAAVKIGFAAALAAASAASFAFLRHFAHRVTDEQEQLTGLATREELWHAALVLWQRSPLFGIGAGNYELELPSTGLLGVRTHANNIYLQSLAEGGLVSLATLVALLVCTVAALGRKSLTSCIASGTLAATLGIIGHQAFDDLFFFPKVGATWWAFLGIALAADTGKETPRKEAAAARWKP